ncbi:MAG: glycosyltransferase family 4 protein [Bdellovibrionales bacterium]|nr:glycosyltransferase family 4 protein [Bdellovibrionales bacterium]
MDKQLSVCVLTTSYPKTPNDDSSIFVKRLVESFANLNISGCVITPYDRQGEVQETQGIFRLFRVKYGIIMPGILASGEGIVPRLKKYPFLIFQAPGLLLALAYKAFKLRNSYKIIQANWLPVGIAALIVNIITKIPYIVSIRGSDMKLLKLKVFNPIFRLVLKKASFIVSVNESFISDLKNFSTLSNEKFHFIPNGVSYEEPSDELLIQVRKQYHLKEEDKYLIHIGRVIPLKKIELLIELLSHKALKEYKLLVVGRSHNKVYLNSLQKKAAQLEVQNRLNFLGSVSPSLIPALLKTSNIYISSSSHEGRPNAMLEALAAGLPVIASNINGHKEIIEHEKNGFVFNFDETEHIAKTILLIEDNQDLRVTISENAKKSIANYTWSATAKKYQDIFRKSNQYLS